MTFLLEEDMFGHFCDVSDDFGTIIGTTQIP